MPMGSRRGPGRGASPERGLDRLLKPLRSEQEAFRLLVYVVVIVAVVVGLVLLVRALLG
jgi:hypothetical protein